MAGGLQRSGVMKELRDSLRGLRDLFFPRRCCVCGAPLSLDEKSICFNCFADLPLTYFWDWEENPAFVKINTKVPVQQVASLFHFRPDAGYSHIMHKIKYEGNTALGFRLGYLLGERLAVCGRFADIDAVVPVPLHPLRRFRRGYNQAEVIARGIAAAMNLPVAPHLLHRKRRTRTQTKLNVEQKARNVRGAFALDGNEAKKLAGAGVGHILIVDDVLTTGSTLSECVREVAERFKVSVASLAYAG